MLIAGLAFVVAWLTDGCLYRRRVAIGEELSEGLRLATWAAMVGVVGLIVAGEAGFLALALVFALGAYMTHGD